MMPRIKASKTKASPKAKASSKAKASPRTKTSPKAKASPQTQASAHASEHHVYVISGLPDRIFSDVASAEATWREYEFEDDTLVVRHLVRTPPNTEYVFVGNAYTPARTAALRRASALYEARAERLKAKKEQERVALAQASELKRAALKLPPHPGARGCLMHANFHMGPVDVFVTPSDTLNTVWDRLEEAGFAATVRCASKTWLVSPEKTRRFIEVTSRDLSLMSSLGAGAGWLLVEACGSQPPKI